MAKPDEELASRVVDRMRKAGLLSQSALSKVQEGLSTGTFSTEDWRLLVEIELSEKKEAHRLED
jgi:hypothetical protein